MLYWTPESSFVYNNLEEVIIPFDGNKLTFSTFANGEVKGFKEVREVKAICFIAKYTTKKTIGYNF